MKVIKSFLVLFLMGLAVSCSTIYGVKYDYDKSANFTSLKTYDWLPIPVNTNIDSLTIERVKNAVNAGLQAKGLMMTSDNPDFLIAQHLGKKTEVTDMGYSYGPHRIDRWGGRISTLEYAEGSLVLDFVNAESKKMIWRGVAKAEVNNADTPDKKEKLINEAVQEILKNFPPKPKE
jgi:hypothetical protein